MNIKKLFELILETYSLLEKGIFRTEVKPLHNSLIDTLIEALEKMKIK